MNTFLHIMLNYILISLVFPHAHAYLMPIIIFSLILDLDHLPYFFSNRVHVLKNGFSVNSRSPLHEIPGVVLLVMICCAFYLITGQATLSFIAALCIVLHALTDFLVGDSRPFFPFSNFLLKSPLGLHGKKRFFFECFSTAITGFICIFVLKPW